MNVAWKIALYNLVYHQLPLIQHCSIFYKKKCLSEYQIFLGEFNGKICSECISCNLEFQKPPLGLSPPLRLWCSIRTIITQLSPYFLNWDSYFNSFWEPWFSNDYTCECRALIWLLNVTVRLLEDTGTKLDINPLFWFTSNKFFTDFLQISMADTLCFTL
jgi:hypothetical protein